MLLLRNHHQKPVKAWLLSFSMLLFSAMVSIHSIAQTPIPYGISLDSVYLDQLFTSKLYIYAYQSFHLYKPASYDAATSPVIIIAHSSGSHGLGAISHIDSIAYRRKALVIAPNFSTNSGGFTTRMRHQEPVTVGVDSIDICSLLLPSTYTLRKIYEHVLEREGRSNVPCYLIGFSAGGQFVTRYMLVRQAYPDSIPIRMAVSASAYYYTFPTDTFTGVVMNWLCGINSFPPGSPAGCPQTTNIYGWKCDEHILQYYNENYGVMVGGADVQPLSDNACAMAQGSNRYERAVNFYNFCDSNAVNRGTALQWLYSEVPGVGHDEHLMYNTKASPADSSSIAETLLFDTPYHTTAFTAPVAAFYADTTKIYLNGTVNFINTSINAASYLWDFGDGAASTLPNPSHTYTSVDTFTVQLTATNSTGCWNWTERRHYIKIVNPVSVNEINGNGFQIKIYPNPSSGILQIHASVNGKASAEVFDLTGRLRHQSSREFKSQQAVMNLSFLDNGMYILRVITGSEVYSGKFVMQR